MLRIVRGWVLAVVLACGCAATEPRDPAAFRAGTARVKITPDMPVMLAGYASRNKVSEGVAADLWARALALEDADGERVVLVAADIIGFGPVISRRIKLELERRHDLEEASVWLVGSHTHSGPVISDRALVDRPEQAKVRDAYVDQLCGRVVEAVGRALDNLASATLWLGRGEARFGVYRRVKRPDGTWWFGDNPEGPTDPDVPVLIARGADGAIQGVVFTYACHLTSVRDGNEGFYKVHPDWGIASSKLEEKLPGATVMYATGCGADLDPSPRGPLEAAERHGESMAAEVARVLDAGGHRPLAGPIHASFRRVELPLETPSRETLERMAAPGGGAQRFAAETLRKLDAGTLPTAVNFPIGVWRFGSTLTMIALGGETCVEYALRLKRELAGGPPLWPIGYANEVMCYIPSERVLMENGYESGWELKTGRGVAAFQMRASGWPTPFAAGLEDRIIGAVHELLRR
jgi:hypothetical protein